MLKTFLFAAAAMLTLGNCAMTPASEEGASCDTFPTDMSGHRQVAIFFATNRAPLPDTAAPLSFDFSRSEDLSYGYLVVAVPTRAALSLGSSTPDFRFAAVGTFPDGAAFARAVRTRSTGRPRLVFVHGYAESFERAAFRYAQLVADGCLDVSAVMFSWPSRDSIIDYIYDRESATYSRQALADVLRLVQDGSNDGQTSVLAHSMGSWIAMEAIASIHEGWRQGHKKRFGAIILASPDIDVDVFRKDLQAVQKSTRVSVLLTSARDVLLGASEFLAHGVPRAGNATDGELAAHHISDGGNFSIVRLDDPAGADCGPMDHRCAETSRVVLRYIRGLLLGGPRQPLPGNDPEEAPPLH